MKPPALAGGVVTVFNPALSDPDKVQRIQSVLTERSSERDTAQEKFISFKAQTQRQAADADYYDVLASQSRKLQNRVAEIVKVLGFEGDEASDLMAAMQHYKAKDGQITQAAPLGFLESEEQEAVLDETGDIRVSLYKALLFARIAEALKGGVLNLRHSYKYRSLDDYLIPKDDWQTHRNDYLQRAHLEAVADCEPTLNALATRLDAQYHQTNQHILSEENPHVHFRKDGSFHVST